MAKVATKDIAEMKDDQLVHYIKDSREELFNLRFRHATGEAREHLIDQGSKKSTGPRSRRSPTSARST